MVIRLAVGVRREHAELALAELLELAPEGLEEVELDDGSIEYAVYGAPGELPSLPSMSAAAGAALVKVSTRHVPDDWGERWRRFHRPVTVLDPAGHAVLRVRPPWSPSGAAALADVVIDPGQAFGTGGHATTRLCLELLVELASAGRAEGALCDIGCGSGVIALAAARLGWTPVVGIDHDPHSVGATASNAVLNGLVVQARRVDIRRETPPSAPTMVANLLAPLLLDLAGRLPRPPDLLVAGGLLRAEADAVAGAFATKSGLHERERRVSGEWAALLLAQPDAWPPGSPVA